MSDNRRQVRDPLDDLANVTEGVVSYGLYDLRNEEKKSLAGVGLYTL